jgi:hypothetical protein
LSTAATALTAAAFWDDGSFLLVAPTVQVGITVAVLH